MAGTFDIVYPQEGRVTLGGGLNNKYIRTIIQDNESPDCLNVVFANGAAETKGGSTQLNTTPIATFAGDGLYTRSDNNGNQTMLAFVGGTMWQLGTTTFTTVPSAQSVFTAGQRVAGAQYENHLFAGNGGVTPYKYDGTYFTRHGVPAPTQTMSALTSATGNVNAQDWVYAYTYVNSAAVEGNLSPLRSTLTVAASSIVSLTSIGVDPQSHGVSSRRIYRATTTAGPFKLVGTIADNTTTTFTDNVAAAALSVTAPTDNGEPPQYSVIVQFQNRLFCNDPANPNFVWYSNSLNPYTFASTNFIPVGDDSFDLVKGLAVYQNGVLVLCASGLYLIYMPTSTPTDWQVIKILSQYGSYSPFSPFLFDNQLMLAAFQSTKFAGFAAVTGNRLAQDRTALETAFMGSDRMSDKIEPDMFNVNEGLAKQITSMVYKNKAYIAVPYGAGATANNRVYLFDFSHSSLGQNPYSWSPLDGISACQFAVYSGNLYYLDANATGLVYQLETSVYNDNGSAINSYFWTKEFSGLPGHENLQKDFRKCKLLVETTGAYYMNLTYKTDSDAGSGYTQQVSLNPGSAVWGTLIWGAGSWGSGANQIEVTSWIGPATGKRIQFKFSNQNTAGQRFKVHGLNFTYNLKGTR